MAIKSEESIASRIISAVGAKDLKDAAQILGENYSSLHNWASQRRDFPTATLIRIAETANVSIDWILTGRETLKSVATDSEVEAVLRALVRDEIVNSTILHEKIQGIVLAMRTNIEETAAFDLKTRVEDEAA